MKSYLYFSALICAILAFQGVFNLATANDCTTAPSLVPNAADPEVCASPYPIITTFTGGCNEPTGNNEPDGYYGNPCTQDLWFKYEPGGTNLLQYNMAFEINFNFATAATVTAYLFYSESKDGAGAVPECDWNDNSTSPFSIKEKTTWFVGTGPSSQVLYSEGLDGSGTYFLVLQRQSGTGGTVEVCIRQMVSKPPCGPPANDRCSNATAFTLGNGIDPIAAAGGVTGGAWSESIDGTTICATKQRINNECNTAGNTEDHYRGSAGLDFCIPNRQVGYTFPTPCMVDLENTVYFTFQLPAGAPTNGWYLHVGDLNCPSLGGTNAISVLVVTNLDCNNSANTNYYRCGSPISGGASLPASSGSVNLGTLSLATTYGVIVDGSQGGSCNFKLLLTRSSGSPVLPAEFAYLEGFNSGYQNHLKWETESETDNSFFEIKRSIDGENFETIGTIFGSGTSEASQTYSFTDDQAPIGLAYYQIVAIDVNGYETRSEKFSIRREHEGFLLHDIAPVPMLDQVSLRFTTPYDGIANIEFLDLSGRSVKQENVNISSGTHRVKIQVSDLAAGVYVVRFQQGDTQIIRKVIKQ